MATRRPIVLVHGGWEGGWYWAPLARILRAQGHEIFTPSLTGLGERAHLLTHDVDLALHIEDILGLVRCEELEDFVLVGHSYGGMVVTGVADKVADRIGALIYLDAFLPEDGQSALDLVSAERRAQLVGLAEDKGDGWRIPPIPAAVWGVDDPAHQAWLDRLSGDHPLETLRQPIALSGAGSAINRRVYIRATAYDPSPFEQFGARLKDDPSWIYREVDCHHFLNVARPEEVADILAEAAT